MTSLIKRISECETGISEVPGHPDFYHYRITTPAKVWENYVLQSNDRILKMTITESGSDELLMEVLEAMKTVVVSSTDYLLKELPANSHFDFLTLVGPGGHEAYKLCDTKLHSLTTECIPVFSSEVSADLPLGEVRSRWWRWNFQDLSRPVPT